MLCVSAFLCTLSVAPITFVVNMTQLRDQNVPEHHVVGLSLTLEREWDKLRWRWQGLVPGIHFRVGSLDLLGHHKEHHVHRIVFISDEICAVGEPLPLQILVAFKPARRISFILKLCFTLAELASDIGPSVERLELGGRF